ncbi:MULTISPECIES: GtrA family protein [Erwinia]|uniref:GtrA family protein n=1 Tax=Erwinia TaxID=551 RepID=UPI000554F5AD|nr:MULTISPECIES: GtrA family protein [Erwinia]
MLKLFTKYASVGVINTLIHWFVFAVMFYYGANQTMSNFGAFCIAVTFSFFVNAKWTFKSETTALRYMLYVAFMGVVASVVGWVADKCVLPPLVTLVVFSLISLVCGFIYSKFIVFREAK